MAWLITGGAGYIGAHVVRDMIAAGRDVVVLDDLSTGLASRLPEGVTLIQGQIGHRDAVRRALTEHEITGVMNFAGRKQVGESVQRPLYYWEQNIGGMQVLLEEMVAVGVKQMVFSSSASVYGEPSLQGESAAHAAKVRITEDTHCLPINPYGATKLAGEWMIGGTAAAHGWSALSLRYFNVAGASTPELGDPAILNLVPLVLSALEEGRTPKVFGDDYATPDGSCIRDYIHVADLSCAHVAAARLVEASQAGVPVVHDSPTVEVARRAADAVHSAAAHMPGGSRVVEASASMVGSAVGRLRESVSVVGQRAAEASSSSAAVAAQLSSLAHRVSGGTQEPPFTGHMAINIGTGRGYSVLEVMDALRTSLGRDFEVEIVGRRAGDPPALVASPIRARKLLGWRARHTLSDMTDSAWAAWQQRP